MKDKVQKIIVAIIIATGVILAFSSASLGMWDEQVYLVKSPNGNVVCAYVKAVGMTGHKKFLSESEAMKFDDFKVIEYNTYDSTKKIIYLAGHKAWVKEKE